MSSISRTDTFRTIAGDVSDYIQEMAGDLAEYKTYDNSVCEAILVDLNGFMKLFYVPGMGLDYSEVDVKRLEEWKETANTYMGYINKFIDDNHVKDVHNYIENFRNGMDKFVARIDGYIEKSKDARFDIAYEEARDERLVAGEKAAERYCEDILHIYSGDMKQLEKANNILLEQTAHASVPFLMGEIHKHFELVKNTAQQDIYGELPGVFANFENAEYALRDIFAKGGKAGLNEIGYIRNSLVEAHQYYQRNIGLFMAEFDYENIDRYFFNAIGRIDEIVNKNPGATEYDLMGLSDVRNDAMLILCFDTLSNEVDRRTIEAQLAEKEAKAAEEKRRAAAEKAERELAENIRKQQEQEADNLLAEAGLKGESLEEIAAVEKKLYSWADVASLKYIFREIKFAFSEVDWDKTQKYNWGVISLVKRETDGYSDDLEDACEKNGGNISARRLKEMKAGLKERMEYFKSHKKIFESVCDYEKLSGLFEMASKKLDFYCDKFAGTATCNILKDSKNRDLKRYDYLLGLAVDRMAQKKVVAEKKAAEEKAIAEKKAAEEKAAMEAWEKEAEKYNAEIENEHARVDSRNALLENSAELKETNESHFTKQSKQFKNFRDSVTALTDAINKTFDENTADRKQEMQKLAALICDVEDSRDAYLAHCNRHRKTGNKVRDSRLRLSQDTITSLRGLKLIPELRTAYVAEVTRRYAGSEETKETYDDRMIELEHASFDKQIHENSAKANDQPVKTV